MAALASTPSSWAPVAPQKPRVLWPPLRRGAPCPGAGARRTVAASAAPFTAAAVAALKRRGSKAAPRTEDPVFRWLSKVLPRGDLGQVLDAGTGPDSLMWLSQQQAEGITAVTACDGMYATLEEDVMDFLNPSCDQVLLGNWRDEKFLRGKSFDVVLADYLLGSVDFFAPYFQVGLLQRLTNLTKLGGLLILVGKEPHEELRSANSTSQLVLDVECFRDAVMTLGNQRPYREMPRLWCAQQLAMDFEVVKGRLFPRKLTVDKVMRNLDWAEEELEKVPSRQLQDDLYRHLNVLRDRVDDERHMEGHVFGQDYALVLKRKMPGGLGATSR